MVCSVLVHSPIGRCFMVDIEPVTSADLDTYVRVAAQCAEAWPYYAKTNFLEPDHYSNSGFGPGYGMGNVFYYTHAFECYQAGCPAAVSMPQVWIFMNNETRAAWVLDATTKKADRDARTRVAAQRAADVRNDKAAEESRQVLAALIAADPEFAAETLKNLNV